jgi:hypothetical protein
MKQRTIAESTQLLPLSRAHIRRRFLAALRPEGALVPLDLDLVEVVADLDPGMIDWQSFNRRQLLAG